MKFDGDFQEYGHYILSNVADSGNGNDLLSDYSNGRPIIVLSGQMLVILSKLF